MSHLITPPAAKAQIDAINAQQNGVRMLVPRATKDGKLVLSAALLTDCGKGQTWEAYCGVLQSLETVESVEWPEEDEE
jgi:hypothetical protein